MKKLCLDSRLGVMTYHGYVQKQGLRYLSSSPPTFNPFHPPAENCRLKMSFLQIFSTNTIYKHIVHTIPTLLNLHVSLCTLNSVHLSNLIYCRLLNNYINSSPLYFMQFYAFTYRYLYILYQCFTQIYAGINQFLFGL